MNLFMRLSWLTAGLQAQSSGDFDTVIGRNLTIEVEETTEYTRFFAYSGNRLGIRLDYILSDDENFAIRLGTPIGQMATMP